MKATTIRTFFRATAAFLLAMPVPAKTDDFSVGWSAVNAGGGTSSAGVFEVNGTLLLGDGVVASAGNLTVEGGFVPLVLVMPPNLFIDLDGNTVIISWSTTSPGFALELTEDLTTATWLPAPDGNPVSVPVATREQFFRLRRP